MFDRENVLPDKALFGWQPIDVSSFLAKHNSFLAHQLVPTDIGMASFNVWLAKNAKEQDVNPAWILVRLQAEQGLIETTPERAMDWAATPKTWKEVGSDGQLHEVSGSKLDYRLRWALGFSAFEGGFRPVLNGRQMAGLGNQVKEMAAWTHRAFLNTTHGIPAMTIDGTPIQPKTRATYAIYRYTPHFKAAVETADIFAKYFPEYTYA